jgi:hypothetical protein
LELCFCTHSRGKELKPGTNWMILYFCV